LIDYLPDLERLKVAMIEQPLRRAGDKRLEELESPIPIGADESCLTLAEYHEIKNRYQVINIKLDKTGGLTEALKIVKAAKADGKQLMVGNMTGSSLSMAPAYVIGQFCSFVDIDGPLLLDKDIDNGLQYLDAGSCWLTLRGALGLATY
jgi:L-Ala-D/L-Glu epimerase